MIISDAHGKSNQSESIALRLPALFIAVTLALLLTGCGIFDQNASGPTPVTAHPTAINLTDAPVHTGANIPVSVKQPPNWVITESPTTLLLAADKSDLEGAEIEGPAFLVTVFDEVKSPEDLLASVDLSNAAVVRQEAVKVGNQDGKLVEATLVSPQSSRGYRAIFAAVIYNEKGYLFTASAPLEQWEKEGPTLNGILSTVILN